MEKFSIDTRLEKAWVTFLVDDNGNTGGWEKEWFPIMFDGIQVQNNMESALLEPAKVQQVKY